MENSFGSFLKQKRLEKELTQKELAKILFVSESTISKWEKGVARPDISLLPTLASILGVTEHEIITASIDKQTREEKQQAKKWRTLSLSWSLFFYIAYAIAPIPCFICNLAISGTLSWFWIVITSLLLSFTFTNLPKLVKKHKLIVLPLSSLGALFLLLGICCIYTNGRWFAITFFAILLAFTSVFTPVYIAKFDIFKKIRKYNDFISVSLCFLLLVVMLAVINGYTLKCGFASKSWLGSALAISLYFFIAINILLLVRFLKINKLLKTSVILYLITLFCFIPPLVVKVKNPHIQKEINDFNILNARLSVWNTTTIDNNVSLIVFLSLIVISTIFLAVGLLVRAVKNKR